VLYSLFLFFFFSSRRRHTRFSRDWSSDVCSSDLRQWAVAQDVANQQDVLQLAGGDATVEVVLADQLAQRVVALQAGAWRADADQAFALEQFGGSVECCVDAERFTGQQGLAWAVFAIDEAVAETAAVAEEIVIHLAIEAIFDAPNLAVAFTGADVAAQRAAVADAGGKLHVPLAVVALGVGLVGEYASGADLGEVAGELAFQHAIFDTPEIHVVMGTKHAQIGAASVVLVVTGTSIAG